MGLLADLPHQVDDDLLEPFAVGPRLPGFGERPPQLLINHRVNPLDLAHDIEAAIGHLLGAFEPHMPGEVEVQGLDPLGDGRFGDAEVGGGLLLALSFLDQQAVEDLLVDLTSRYVSVQLNPALT